MQSLVLVTSKVLLRVISRRRNQLHDRRLFLVPHPGLPVLVTLQSVPTRLNRRELENHDGPGHTWVRLALGNCRSGVDAARRVFRGEESTAKDYTV